MSNQEHPRSSEIRLSDAPHQPQPNYTTHYEPSGSVPGPHLLDQEGRQGLRRLFSRASGGRLWHGFAVRRPPGKDARETEGQDRCELLIGVRPMQTAVSMDNRCVKRNTSTAFFTERSLAAYLAVSDRTIRNWIRRGELPSYKLGAARRIDPADVDDFLARHRDEAA